MALQFGIVGTAAYGLLQEVSESETAAVAEVRDETGKVNNRTAYSVGKEATARFVVNGAVPSAGGTATIGSTLGLIETKAVTSQNTAHQTGTLTVRTADSATLTPV
jgi:hypothetical protein